MSDGPNDGSRLQRELAAVSTAANALAVALDQVRDRAFGLSDVYLDEVNDELERLGLKLVRRSKK